MNICNFRKKQVLLWIPPILTVLVIFGCAGSPERRHPEFQSRIHPIKTLYLMPPDALVLEHAVSGGIRPDPARSREFGDRFAHQVAEQFRLKDYRVMPFSIESDRSDIGEIMALYQAVNKSIQLHTYGPSIFPEKCDQFEYSVGAVESFLARKGADGLLFVRVRDRNTPGRYRTYVSLAVAGTNGDILWYSAGGTKSAVESRREEPTVKLVQSLVHSFPEAVR